MITFMEKFTNIFGFLCPTIYTEDSAIPFLLIIKKNVMFTMQKGLSFMTEKSTNI